MHTNWCIFIETYVKNKVHKFWVAINESYVTLGEFLFSKNSIFLSVAPSKGPRTLDHAHLSNNNIKVLIQLEFMLHFCCTTVRWKEIRFKFWNLSLLTIPHCTALIRDLLMDRHLNFTIFFLAAYQVRCPQQSVLQKLQEQSHQMEIPELQHRALWHQCPLHQQLPLHQFVLIMHLHRQSWVWFFSSKHCVLFI